MSALSLEKHPNGKWYIHWTEGRRTRRLSTKACDLAAAKVVLADWLRPGAAPVEPEPEPQQTPKVDTAAAAYWRQVRREAHVKDRQARCMYRYVMRRLAAGNRAMIEDDL